MDWDSVYALTLLIAMIAGAAGVACSLLTMVLASRRRDVAGMQTILIVCGSVTLVTATASVFVHAKFGHGTSSPEPMNAIMFATSHVAYAVVLACAVLTWVTFFVVKKQNISIR